MSLRRDKKGRWITYTNRSHHLQPHGYNETSQPNPLNDHQPRAGRKSRKLRCCCECCAGKETKQIILDKITKKEIQNELDNLE